MNWTVKLSAACGIALLFALPAIAHHSYTPYDLERTVTLEGVVTNFLWANPHVYIDVRARNEGDEAVTWAIEALSTGSLANLGWSASSLAPGDRVIATVHPAREPEKRIAFGRSVLKADGILLSMPHLRDRTPPSAQPATPFVADDLSGHWRVSST